MVGMSPSEWNKPNSSTREPRINILLRAVENGTKLITTSNTGVVIKKNKENIDQIESFRIEGKKSFPLIAKDGRKIMSNQIAKTSIFGGGMSGAGGGTVQTAQAESLQCFYCAAVTGEGKKSYEEIRSNLKKHAARVYIGGTSFERAIASNEDWHDSAYATAIALLEKGYINKSHTFHRDDPKMKQIYRVFKNSAFKNSGMPVLSDDKWNPGDIWAISGKIDLKKELDDTTVASLNSSLVRAFESRKIVGISLKKIVNPEQMKISEVNLSEHRSLSRYNLSGFNLQSTRSGSTFFSNRGGILMVGNKNKVEFRPDRYLSPIKGEIKLATARGGGVGNGILSYGIQKYLKKQPYTPSETVDISKKILNGDRKPINEFYKMASVFSDVSESDFNMELKSQSIDIIHSKFQVTQLFYLLHNSPVSRRDDYISYIMNYAGSSLQESSVYVKVYQ